MSSRLLVLISFALLALSWVFGLRAWLALANGEGGIVFLVWTAIAAAFGLSGVGFLWGGLE